MIGLGAFAGKEPRDVFLQFEDVLDWNDRERPPFNTEKEEREYMKRYEQNQFQVFQAIENHDKETILLAYYDYEDYSGSAFVLFVKGGKLYEVNGSHCSCYGLEGLWTPEETTFEALRHRMTAGKPPLGKGYDGENLFFDELRDLIYVRTGLFVVTPEVLG